MNIKLKNVFLIVALVAVISTMTISVANHAYADRTHHRGHNSHHVTDTGIDPTAQNSGIDNTAIRGHHSNHHATDTGIDPTAQNSGIDNMGNDIFNHGASISPDNSISKNIGTPGSTSSFFGTSFP
jgi:hypothetical protein